MTRDAAETSNIGESLAAIGAALDEFARFGHGDAQPARERWQRMLEQPLPRHGAGLDTVLAELCEQLIPNGSAVARPGFSAYITTGPTTVAIAAATAAMLAAPQRQTLHAFNFI